MSTNDIISVKKTTAQRVDEIFAKFCRIVESNCIQELLGTELGVVHFGNDEFFCKTRLAKIREIFDQDLKYLRKYNNDFDEQYVYARFLHVLYHWGIVPSNDTVYYIFRYYSDIHLLRCLIHTGFAIDYYTYGIDYDSGRYFQKHFDVGWNKLLIDAGIDKTSLCEQLSRRDLNVLDVFIKLGNEDNEYHNFVIEDTAIFAVLIEM